MCNMDYSEEVIFNKVIDIKPNDTLFLGSGKGFNKGENQWVNTMLMPYPSMVYGAICSLMLSENDYRRQKYLDEKEQSSNPKKYLFMGNIYLCYKNKYVYIPAPLDLYTNERKCEISYANIKKIKNNITCSLKDMEYLFFNDDSRESERCDSMFLNLNNFYNSYYHTDESLSIITPSDLIGNSYKVGIQIGENGVAKEGNLYRLDLTEFEKDYWSYLVEYHIEDEWWIYNDKKSLTKGYLKLGGENKSCKFHCYDKDETILDEMILDKNSIYDIRNHSEFIKIIFTSPCIFKDNDWKPKFKKNIDVISATIGKAHNLGGFDMVLKKPKPMSKAIPSGSVYILKSNYFKDKSLKQIKKIILEGLENKIIKYTSGFGQFEVIPLDESQMEGIDEYEK